MPILNRLWAMSGGKWTLLWLGSVLVIPVGSYLIGYLGIDVLDWVTLPARQLQGDTIHISRFLIGMMTLLGLLVPLVLWFLVVVYDE